MTTTTVTNTAGLVSALKLAHSGDTILLASGTYSEVDLTKVNIAGTVNITSKNMANQAVLNGLIIQSSSGLNFSNLKFSSVNGRLTASFAVYGSNNVHFTGITAYGSGPSVNHDGILFENSNNVSVTNSHFNNLMNGVVDLNNTNVSILNNTISQIGGDGIDNGGTSSVVISGNSFTDFETYGSNHADAIQFWTTNTTTAASNIVITGNSMTQGAGSSFQGIFVKDDVGTLPFSNVTINNNTVNTAMGNGILVQGASNVTLNSNDLVSVVGPAAASPTLSRIVLESVAGASLQNNMAAQYYFDIATSGVTASGNQTNAYINTATGALQASAPALSINERQTASGKITLVDDATGSPYVASVSHDAVSAAGLTLTGAYGKLTIQSNGTYTYAASQEGLTVGKVYTDVFTAIVADSHGANTSVVLEFLVTGSATGNSAANTIVGGAGTETITGGGGADTLTSGTGPDTFAYTALSDSTPAAHDTIQGFKAGDTLNLLAVDPLFQIVSAFDHHAHELVITNDGGGAWDIYGDTTGAGVANFQIHLTGALTTPSAANIHL